MTNSLDDLLRQQRLLSLMLENALNDMDDQDRPSTLEDITTQWEINSTNVECKVNAYGHTIRKLESEKEYYRSQVKYFQSKVKNHENKLAWLKSKLIAFLLSQYGEKFKTLDFNLSITNSVSVEIDDTFQGDIPDEFIKEQKPSDYISKTAVRQFWTENGFMPLFAKLIHNKSVRGL
jgi:hypothetical protein